MPLIALTVSPSKEVQVIFLAVSLDFFFQSWKQEKCLAGIHPQLGQLTEYGPRSQVVDRKDRTVN